jgi:redox-sensitive bicupin YhaK (pirin superfamily)
MACLAATFNSALQHLGLEMESKLTHSIVLVAGLPLDQKVVQYGPFVLNTQDEVYQALMDYQTHSNGFERAKGWQSEIGKSMIH